ncbi:MAG: prepilin-type N-terminal cleavage/methylation domain-containing protein [Kofleriaceae bacterium]
MKRFLKRRTRNSQRGLTMLEIMIVIAILGLVMGLVIVPKVMGMFGESQTKIAQLAVTKFASEAYPQWALRHTDKPCPESLLEIAQHIGKTEADTKDPWGSSYKMICGAGQLPAGVSDGIAVLSFGPDKNEGTADDIKSW